MASSKPVRVRNLTLGANLRTAAVLLILAIILAVTIVAAQLAQGQTYQVLHNFTGGHDGATPAGALTLDKKGNLYGTAALGGFQGGDCGLNGGCGTVFKLTHQTAGWVLTPIHTFTGPANADGADPQGRLLIGPDGDLYGTTLNGGQGLCPFGCGTIYRLNTSNALGNSAWTETVLFQFLDDFSSAFGVYPGGDLILDYAGNLYGTASQGGEFGQGNVFKLTHSTSGWWPAVVWSFSGGSDGAQPIGGVIFDKAGNLYGTALYGGLHSGPCNFAGCGTVYQLTPSGSGWALNVLYSFQGGNDGGNPAGVIFDNSGTLLYGAAKNAGPAGWGGTVYDLTPSGGSWTFTELYAFVPAGGGYGYGPSDRLTMDAAGNLYGTISGDGLYGYGSVFKLTPALGGWTYTSLHDFTGGSDGGNPVGGVILDAKGNLYGTALLGGAFSSCSGVGGCGVVWKITP
jgi:uncharacterized repeat protein (TIGR03803 family)